MGRELKLLEAAEVGDLETIRRLILGGVDVNAQYESAETPLHLASCNDHIDVVRFLLENNADVNAKSSNIPQTPLGQALVNRKVDVAKLLLAKGADVNDEMGFWSHRGEMTPLGYILSTRDLHQLLPHFLDHGADINQSMRSGRTLLHLACRGSVDISQVSTLLTHGSQINARDRSGEAPLHYAVCNKNPTVAILQLVSLLINNHAEVNLSDNLGQTPLHKVLRGDVTQMLLSNGAFVEVKDQRMRSPVHGMVLENRLEAVDVLLEYHRSHDGDVSSLLLSRCRDGDSPFHKAGTSEMAKLLLEQPLQNKRVPPVCYEMLFLEDNSGLTLRDRVQNRILFGKRIGAMKHRVVDYQSLLQYLESYTKQPLAVPASTSIPAMKTIATPKKQQRLTLYDGIAVRVNPALTVFQQAIAHAFVEQTFTRDSEAQLPDDLKYAILGYLAPVDLMKR